MLGLLMEQVNGGWIVLSLLWVEGLFSRHVVLNTGHCSFASSSLGSSDSTLCAASGHVPSRKVLIEPKTLAGVMGDNQNSRPTTIKIPDQRQ
jgi:hypothetical protein